MSEKLILGISGSPRKGANTDLMLAEALRRNGVEFEMHIYPKGEHGLSLAAEETAGERREMLVPSVQSWIHLAKTWIEGFGNA